MAPQRIADIIGVIDGIAFQTNILAPMPPSRGGAGGEQGRGFAVVAGEVTLAQRFRRGGEEIKTLIGSSVERVEVARWSGDGPPWARDRRQRAPGDRHDRRDLIPRATRPTASAREAQRCHRQLDQMTRTRRWSSQPPSAQRVAYDQAGGTERTGMTFRTAAYVALARRQ